MTYYPERDFFGVGFIFHGVYFDCNLISGSIFLKLVLKITVNCDNLILKFYKLRVYFVLLCSFSIVVSVLIKTLIPV